MAKVNIYINFNGNCEEAFNFYKSVFGGDFQYLGCYKDVPPPDRKKFRPENDEKIMHVSLPISKETILMGSDNPNSTDAIIVGNNISLSIDTNQREEADLIFTQLSAGAKIRDQMSETFWGAYFGSLTDRFGINWLINCDISQTTTH